MNLEEIKNKKIKDIESIKQQLCIELDTQFVVDSINALETIKEANDFNATKLILEKISTLEFLKQKKINELSEPFKILLKDSDYKAIKYAEGHIPELDYHVVKSQRQSWRDAINEIESNVNKCNTINELEEL